jgi:hypothetical protein
MVTLQSGETVLRSGQVAWLGQRGPRSGKLTLTNQALIFEGPIPRQRPGAGPGGRWGPAARPLVQGELRIGLWRCKNATPSSGPRGPVLDVELLHRHLFFQVDNVPAWAQIITTARGSAPPAPPGALERLAGGPGGTPASMPRCEYCGHLSPATATRCESCGAPF